MTVSRGRPRASSREILADAAAELFLEQGYDTTSVTEITRRAGVSRSSFFNYFTGKSATLWFALDSRIEAMVASVSSIPTTPRAAGDQSTLFDAALAAFRAEESPETLALAIVDARTMGVEDELALGRATRQLQIADALAARLVRDGAPEVDAHIIASAYAAAVMISVWRWAGSGAGRHSLDDVVSESFEITRNLLRNRE